MCRSAKLRCVRTRKHSSFSHTGNHIQDFLVPRGFGGALNYSAKSLASSTSTAYGEADSTIYDNEINKTFAYGELTLRFLSQVEVKGTDAIVLDIGCGTGFVFEVLKIHFREDVLGVGVDHDTAAFAVNTIRRWWRATGRAVYPGVRSLLVVADSGGSNGSRVRLWKWQLHKFAGQTGLTIHVCHLPPAPASGTRSSIACSRSSVRTGGVSRC